MLSTNHYSLGLHLRKGRIIAFVILNYAIQSSSLYRHPFAKIFLWKIKGILFSLLKFHYVDLQPTTRFAALAQ